MKKLLLILALTMLPSSAFALIGFGIQGGQDMSKLGAYSYSEGFVSINSLEMESNPAGIGFKIEITMSLFPFLKPFLGQTYPELIATGWQTILSCSYILNAPFLNGGLSFGRALVPWGNIISGLSDWFTIFEIWSKKPKLSFVTWFLFIDIDPIFFKYQPNIGIHNNSFLRINTGELKIVCK